MPRKLWKSWSAIVFVVSALLASPGLATNMPEETRQVSGEVLQIAGTFTVTKGPNGKGVLDVSSNTVLVQDDAGQQVALRIGKDTKQDGLIDAGDRIHAAVTPDGRILAIRPAGESRPR